MLKSIFLIDIDGVACAHAKAICERIIKEYEINTTVEEVTTWDHNFGPITFTQAVEKYYQDENFVQNMEVTPGFRNFFEYINEKMTVKFASARKYPHSATLSWVKMHFGYEYEVLFVEKRKTHLEFDYLIDDYLDEIMLAAAEGKTSFLLRQPWNDNDETKHLLKDYKSAHLAPNFSYIINFLKWQ